MCFEIQRIRSSTSRISFTFPLLLLRCRGRCCGAVAATAALDAGHGGRTLWACAIYPGIALAAVAGFWYNLPAMFCPFFTFAQRAGAVDFISLFSRGGPVATSFHANY